MKYSIVSFSGNVLPAVWDAKGDTEEAVLQEAMEMYKARLSIVPALLINWEQAHVKRIVISVIRDSVETIDNAKELFGIATTAEHFEEIAKANEQAIAEIEAESE